MPDPQISDVAACAGIITEVVESNGVKKIKITADSPDGELSEHPVSNEFYLVRDRLDPNNEVMRLREITYRLSEADPTAVRTRFFDLKGDDLDPDKVELISVVISDDRQVCLSPKKPKSILVRPGAAK